ncbi:hypothetical protein DH2020_031819 [Rehmannia glutinosa]|uniref:Peptidase S26 domain-containing protein n=1 Tax=Rehmannia glutinosa TaxID=99300 RepID=A0ABR0VKX5_REHGL
MLVNGDPRPKKFWATPFSSLSFFPFCTSRKPTSVYGPSMLPTLNFTGDVLLVDKLSPMLGKVGPGDVVLVRSPENPRKTITKRIVGLEGDIVTFLVDPGRSDLSHSLVVPKGHVWIQGDNIYASNDSRHIGPVPYGLILGKVFCRGKLFLSDNQFDCEQMRSSTSWVFSIPMEESQVSCGHHKTLDDWHNDG